MTSKLFEEAIVFAVEAHRGQTRKGDGRPYILHPLSVMQTISKVKKSVNIWMLGVAAILHDVVEDCYPEQTREQKLYTIATKFGWKVAAIVDELSIDKEQAKVVGKTRYLCDELKRMSSYAFAIKLCDRLDNLSDMDSVPEEFRARYKKETQAILDHVIPHRKLTSTHKRIISMIKKKMKTL